MGRIEKLVVLVVLFTITAILVVSLNTRTPSQPEGGPELADAQSDGRARARWSPTADLLAEREAPVREEPQPEDSGAALDPRGSEADESAPAADASILLSSEARQPTLAERYPTIPQAWSLVTLEGLSETSDPATLLYTCRGGESLESLARRYYGDAAKSELLRRYNEGLRQLASGRTVFVPVLDDTPVDKSSEYVVQDGDNLWNIAKKVYGKGSRWEEILAANSALLPTPDALRAGMTLRIPE